MSKRRSPKPALSNAMIHPSSTLFLRQYVGEAKGDDGAEYEMSISMSHCTPIIRSKRTGRFFTVNWQGLINLAVELGIDLPETKP